VNGKAQEHVYAIARLAGIDPNETPLLMLHVEGKTIKIHYVKDDVVIQQISDYFV
jgi:uncharacterized lipoprotein YehR (DUF1307 family)